MAECAGTAQCFWAAADVLKSHVGWTAETTQQPCVSGEQPKPSLHCCRQGGREQGTRRGVALEEGPGVVEAVDAAVGHRAPAAARGRGRVV